MNLSRRQVLRGVTAAIAGAATSPGLRSSFARDEPPLPLVDTHQHLWDLDAFRLPWLEGAPKILRRSYSLHDYQLATEGLNLAKAVYMEVNVAPEQQQKEADWITQVCRDSSNPTVAAVVSGRPSAETFARYARQFRDSPYIKGIRRVLHDPDVPRGTCLGPTFVASMHLLAELNLSFDLCMRPGELSDAERLVRQCPDTRFILDHCGNADPRAFLASTDQPPAHNPEAWRRDIGRLARCENLVCKISGIVARAPRDWRPEMLAPIVNHCLDEFGPERVMFGGDWPVCRLGAEYRGWVAALREIVASRPRAMQRQLFHDNAVRFYGLA